MHPEATTSEKSDSGHIKSMKSKMCKKQKHWGHIHRINPSQTGLFEMIVIRHYTYDCMGEMQRHYPYLYLNLTWAWPKSDCISLGCILDGYSSRSGCNELLCILYTIKNCQKFKRGKKKFNGFNKLIAILVLTFQ